MTRPPLTIVVPVYDHWTSLAGCLAAIKQHADPSWVSVVIINDNGPHADTLEELILSETDGDPLFRYVRNDENLGFVRTCNRAVFEIDDSDNDILLLNSDAELSAGALEEMMDVLYLDEHHAGVCPRSNNASIATIPLVRRHGAPRNLDLKTSEAIGAAVRPLLPRYSIAPVAVGFSMLLRRSVIRNHGLFDEIYGRGYNEENDFCMRVNALGYSFVLANQAWVHHVGSLSFAAEKYELDQRNGKIIASRYPHYFSMVHTFRKFGYTAADHFAEIIADAPVAKRSVLIDLHHLSHVHNGSTRFALAFLAWLRENASDDVSITICAQRASIAFFGLDALGFATVEYGKVDEVFDVGIALAPVNTVRQLAHLNRTCARWVVCHFDMIAVRALDLLWSDRLRATSVGLGLQYADRIVAISEFSLNDAANYYPAMTSRIRDVGVGVRIGLTTGVEDFVAPHALERELLSQLEAEPFVLVVGNHYPHKQVVAAVNSIRGRGFRVVAFGPVEGLEDDHQVAVLPSGFLSDAGVAELYRHAALVVFPSSFEGFGLPLVEALDAGTPVVTWDAEISREITQSSGLEDAVRFFSRFDELGDVVVAAAADRGLKAAALRHRGKMPDMTHFCEELWSQVSDVVGRPVDVDALTSRWEALTLVEEISGV